MPVMVTGQTKSNNERMVLIQATKEPHRRPKPGADRNAAICQVAALRQRLDARLACNRPLKSRNIHHDR